jgi:hypothetical protein
MTRLAPTCGAGRLLRGGAVGLLTGALAIAAHVEADGAVPDLGLAVLPVVLLCAVASALAARERGPLQILALVGVGQLAVHTFLTTPAVHHPHRGSHLAAADHSTLMVAAHAVATVLVVAVLAGAERTVFALTAALGSILPQRLSPLPATAPLRVSALAVPASPHLAEMLGREVRTRRGPPRAATVTR